MNKILHFILNNPRGGAMLLGAVAALSFAPIYCIFALFFGVWGLLHLIDDAINTRQLYERLYAFGLGFFGVGTYWVGLSFRTIDIGWLGFPAVAMLSAILAVFVLPIGLFIKPFKPKSVERRIAFAVGFALCEWLRGHMFTGFPWSLIGSVWGAYTLPGMNDLGLSILQMVSFVGVYGLSFLTMLAVVLITGTNRTASIIALNGIIVCSFFGGLRMNDAKTELLPVNLRMIQPSIDQHLKWLPEKFEHNIELQLALSGLKAERSLSAIIWPEAAVTRILNESLELREILSTIVPQNGHLITGTPRREGDKIFTTLSVLNEKAEITHTYKKSHLVPFGEYVPFKKILPVEKVTPGALDFAEGDGLKTLKISALPPFSPLICFEALFPGEVVSKNSVKRPEWLLNITNDAWYGVSAGPYQHLALVRIRAIEEGLPLVRVANNGVSAVIDPCGRILHKLGLNDIGFIDFELPKALPRTFYSRFKDSFLWGLLIISMIGALIMRRRHTVTV
ncbi:MAG: apolipoprotein N-acyltransferase [Candidatus Paracaedibacteraceae bacterium]|nr:apolipoprotein N-acyltransferase [Candidatus Paracaedibacteraceae bacterium]